VTILQESCTTTPGATTMPVDPTTRYHTLVNLKGLWIILISGDHAVEGWLIDITRPNMSSETPAPVATFANEYTSVMGPVLAGDIIAAPLTGRCA
jgi:hypothetical protein